MELITEVFENIMKKHSILTKSEPPHLWIPSPQFSIIDDLGQIQFLNEFLL